MSLRQYCPIVTKRSVSEVKTHTLLVRTQPVNTEHQDDVLCRLRIAIKELTLIRGNPHKLMLLSHFRIWSWASCLRLLQAVSAIDLCLFRNYRYLDNMLCNWKIKNMLKYLSYNPSSLFGFKINMI